MRALSAAAGSAVLLAVLAIAAASTALGTTAGARALLHLVPGLEVQGLSGSIAGGLGAERLSWQGTGGTSIEVGGLRIGAVSLAPLGLTGPWIDVRTDAVAADRVDVRPAASGGPTTLPTDLDLPITLRVGAFTVGELATPTLQAPMRGLSGRLELGYPSAASAGPADGAASVRAHSISDLRARWDTLVVEGEVHLGTQAPLPLQARLGVQALPPADAAPGVTWPAWTAQLQASGPLESFEVKGLLQAEGQSLAVDATVEPEARWPLARLELAADRLDLAALRRTLPRTALSGQVTLRPAADASAGSREGPLQIGVALRNAQPSTLAQGGLPVASVSAEASWHPSEADRLRVDTLDVGLADARGAAGRLRGQAQGSASGGEATLRLEALEPARLDARAPALRVDGRVVLRASGLGPATRDRGTAPSVNPPRADIELAIDGRAAADVAYRPVTLSGRLSVTPDRVTVRDLQASANGAVARVTATLGRPTPVDPGLALASWPDSALTGEMQVDLVHFDPSTWWAGPAGSAWRRGPHRLDGRVQASVRWPAGAVRHGAWPQGSARAVLEDSVLAGVPLSIDAEARREGAGSVAGRAMVQAGPNRVDVELAGSDRFDLDRATIRVRAPALRALQPLTALWPPALRASSDPPSQPPGQGLDIAGAVDLDMQVSGPWPRLQAEVSGNARALQWRHLSLATGSLDGRFDPAPGAPLELRASVERARWNGRTVDQASLRLTGTLQSHEARAEAVLSALPPDWVRAVSAPVAPSTMTSPPAAAATGPKGTRVALSASGGWRLDGAAAALDPKLDPVVAAWQVGHPTRWRGQLESLQARATPAEPTDWLRAGPIDIDLLPPSTAAARGWVVETGAGTADALGARLRLDGFRWAEGLAGEPAALDLRAELEPLEVAPLLRRAQPDFGWEGDLRVGGRLNIRSGPRTEVDIVLARRSGDLKVREDIGVQALGLEEARASIEARDGQWTFSAGLAGQVLGAASLLAVAESTPRALWPEPTAPLRGVVEAQASNLGTWGAWVPAGWRLAGELRLYASLGGRFGAPQWTGELRGRGLEVRNLLEGVQVTDGELAVALAGATARIERLRARAGAGSLDVTGDATLGEQPRARLSVVADRFQALGRIDRRLVLSGRTQADFDRHGLRLAGRLGVDEALVDFTRADAPSLGDDVVVDRDQRPAAEGYRPPSVDPATGRRSLGRTAARQVDLDLTLDLGERLRLRGRGLDASLRGELRVTSPNNRIAIQGAVRVVDGTYAAYGQKLAITRGLLTFTGPPDNPRLDIQATRPDLDVIVGVAVAGSAAEPRARLFSEPEMAETDKLSWLLLGRGSDGLGRNDLALLQRAAFAVLAGEGSSGQDPLSAALGLDDLSVRQGEGETRETIVSVGKQLHRRWYLGYERSLNATAGTWQLIYRLAQRFTVRAQSGVDNSLDLIWTVRWQ